MMSSYLRAPERHEKGIAGERGEVQHAPGMLREVTKQPGSASSCTAECRSRAEAVGTFLALEASRQLVNVRYDGDRDFFIICSNGLDMKTLAH